MTSSPWRRGGGLARRTGFLALVGSLGACAATLPEAVVTPVSFSAHPAVPALDADFAKADTTRARVDDLLDLGQGLRLPVQVETTSQGNGTLAVANLVLRLKDRHDDGLVYAGSGVLRLDVVPLAPAPALPALVVSGVALHTGEKETDPAVPEAVVVIYTVDCASGRLVRVWRNTDVGIEVDSAAAGGAIRCPP